MTATLCVVKLNRHDVAYVFPVSLQSTDSKTLNISTNSICLHIYNHNAQLFVFKSGFFHRIVVNTVD